MTEAPSCDVCVEQDAALRALVHAIYGVRPLLIAGQFVPLYALHRELDPTGVLHLRRSIATYDELIVALRGEVTTLRNANSYLLSRGQQK